VTTLLAFLFVLGVLIFVHELGHFLAARYHGVRVITFSLGFGPKILKFTRGDTEYCISIVPLGGYVKMAGENPDDPRAGQPDEFLSKSKWQRFQILIAGPLMS
jgi:regulator of sigma E protease